MNLKIRIIQENIIYEHPYDQNQKPYEISSRICSKYLNQKAIKVQMTKLMYSNQELNHYQTLLEQGINPQKTLDFYYSQSFQIKCLCDNSNFNLEVQGLTKIEDCLNIIKSKFAKPYQKYQIQVFCKGRPQKLDTLWVQTGITNSSQVEIKILLPVQFTYIKQQFQELIPSNWKVHKIITYIIAKKQINEIIQITSKNNIIDYDLELSQMYQNLDWQIEEVKEPSYTIKLQDGRDKIIKISSKYKVSDLCEQIKKEFNIIKSMNLELQYGLMKLNNQAFIIDEMVLNGSTILVNNLNLKFYDQLDENLNAKLKDIRVDYEFKETSVQQQPVKYDNKYSNKFEDKLKDLTNDQLQIILLNKRNPQQILLKTVQSTSEVNTLDQYLIPYDMKDKFVVQYFQEKNKSIFSNSIFGILEKDKENKIQIEFLIEKKKSSLKTISSYDQIYEFKFQYRNRQYIEKVQITESLKQIEQKIKEKYLISNDYSMYSNDSFEQNQTILNLGLSSFNIVFDFKLKNTNNRSFEIMIQPNRIPERFETSQVKNVLQLREKIKQKYLRENETARIQIKLNQKNLHDDELLSQLIQENPQKLFEAIILDQFEVIFIGPNQKKITDVIYEDYLIRDSVICLGLEQNYTFINKNLTIRIDNSFQFYQINKQNSIIEYLDKDNFKITPEMNKTSFGETNSKNTYSNFAGKNRYDNRQEISQNQQQSLEINNQEHHQQQNNMQYQYTKQNSYIQRKDNS